MRRRRELRFLLPLALHAFVAGCASTALPEREGVDLYVKKCSGCHRPYAPGERTVLKWRQVLPEMARRAKLTPEELATIQRYLAVEPAPSHEAHPPAGRS